MRSQLKHLSKRAQSDISLNYATWANNHRGKSKAKKMNKRLAKNRYKRLLENEIEMEDNDWQYYMRMNNKHLKLHMNQITLD